MGDAERDELVHRREAASGADRRHQRFEVRLEAVLRALGLSAREREVALISAHGQSAKEIARDLRISPWTVQDHLKAVYAKTGVNSRSDLGSMITCR